LQAAAVGQLDVEQDEVYRSSGHRRACLGEGCGLHEIGAANVCIGGLGQNGFDEFAVEEFVLDEQDL
jgi:hypothetical protein